MINKITNDIIYIGVDDKDIDLFEGQFDVPNGMAYNSYVILDDKTAVMDTVDASKSDEWLNNLETTLEGKKPDYLVVQHVEPDHSGSIKAFLTKYPETVVVGNTKTFVMISQFFSEDLNFEKVEVKEGDTLNLGAHTLNFVMAPMVHWPEVMVTYDSADKVLFSADGFGKFGALDTDEDWACEARRYYFNIVGKYGAQVQALLKKAAALEIKIICPLHGPILTENLDYYLNLYDIWSSYTPENDGVTIAYVSFHGNTKAAVEKMKEILLEKGAKKVSTFDLMRDDFAECVEDSFRYSKLIVAATTYNMEAAPMAEHFANYLKGKNYQKRTVGFIENGTWAPVSAKLLSKTFGEMKDIKLCENVVTIKSSLKDINIEQMNALADEILA
ncbi:MAG: FprA family A-type flavoprotein [Acutalibacteraceae bacterium]|nr:FprA family A-type flavoprotein [Acutalibacteraceae bacterium]